MDSIGGRLVGARKGPKRAPVLITPARLPAAQLEALWLASHAVDDRAGGDLVDSAAAFYFARRGWCARAIAQLDLLRLTPLDARSGPNWWPRAWAHTWRLMARGYDARGNLASIAGASIVPDVSPALRWPKGCTRRHVLADELGAAFLASPADSGVDRVIICEHFDDFITLSLAVAEAGRAHAVLGVMPEAVPTLRGIRWPDDIPIVVKSRSAASAATDDPYCVAVRDELPRSADLRRSKPNSQEGAR